MLNVTESMIMAIALTASFLMSLMCAILLLRSIMLSKGGTSRRAPMILALMALMVAIFKVIKFINLFHNPQTNPLVESLPPVTVVMALPFISLMLLYPIEVMRPGWLKWKHTLWFVIPWLIEVGISTQMTFTHLVGAHEVYYHIHQPDVWWRLVMCGIAVFINLIIILLPYNKWKSSASRQWQWTYFSLVIMQISFSAGRITTGNMAIHLLVECGGIIFILWTTYAQIYELIPVPRSTTEEPEHEKDKTNEPLDDAVKIWKNIELVMEDGVFRDPELSFDKLCRMLNSNRTMVQQALKENADMNFSDYLDRVRVSHTLALMQSRPDIDISSAFFDAGYRTRSTASHSFKKVTGMSPEEWEKSHV